MTIKAKIILADMAVFGLVLVAVALAVYDRTRESEIAKLDSQLEVFATGFITEFEDEWESKDFPEENELQAVGAPGFPGVRIELIDTTGNDIFSRGSLPAINNESLQWAFAGNPIFETIRVNDTLFRQLIRPIEAQETADFVLRLAAPLTELYSRLHDLTLILVVSVTAALFLSALSVYLITRLAFKPMVRMVDTAERISASSLHHRLTTPNTRDEVRRLADALNEMMSRIEDAFNSQRQFVADASHELRTPLTVIYSELEFLKRHVEDKKSREGIDAALSETDRLSRLVDQLLLLARIDARKLVLDIQPVRLDELLIDITKMLQAPAESNNIRLELHIDEAIEIGGDAEKLRRVFLNITQNALKYSPPGGQVFISLGKEGGMATVTIRDQGPGIAAADLPNIFKRFYRASTARAEREGSGLGLAIAKELVEAHGGRITIASEPGAGTTIRINLPIDNLSSPHDPS